MVRSMDSSGGRGILLNRGCEMNRYEYIQNGGIEEMARAISFMVVRSFSDECESITKGVQELMPLVIDWLNVEIERGE